MSDEFGVPDVSYEVWSKEDLTSNLTRLSPSDQANVEWMDDYGKAVVRVEGAIVRVLGMDGGEPEDQTLGRDWAWVAPALESAYELGGRHASRYLGAWFGQALAE